VDFIAADTLPLATSVLETMTRDGAQGKRKVEADFFCHKPNAVQ
jgi:hypothetical protein